MPNRDRESLQDIARAAGQILNYAQGQTRQTLSANPMRLDAVLYELVVLGEAARRLSQPLRDAHSEVPWREMIGMRSVITHGYDEVEEDELWKVIERDLPELIAKIEKILETL